MQTAGIHHITALAADPRTNLDFYSGTLGLRLVKKTVNFDAPDVYHLYYGDGAGTPGTILTFFPWPDLRDGRPGAGQATAVGFRIAPEALAYWQDRLGEAGVRVGEPEERFGETVLAFQDPDGLPLELVARVNPPAVAPWESAPVPARYAIRGFAGLTLLERQREPTEALLLDQLGYRTLASAGERVRYLASGPGPGETLDLLESSSQGPGVIAAGSVHHIAFRVADDAAQAAARTALVAAGYSVSPVRDRQYFHSIYFNEPGGVLFELATDPPGFATDETPESLGTSLKLPPWLESSRARIEQKLPRLAYSG
ncbi:MAG TPA: ring-cleaving dioxygenase [Chloroflexota bacterium]|nr:ring-cleaving dioxygenase [Chloroflexota bacterium]